MRAPSKSPSRPVSNWKRQANRRNSKKSTGPRTPQGKKTVSKNATTHGLFCHALVLDGEDPALLHHLRQEHIKSLKPQDLLELSLVDRIVAHTWKLRRLQESERRLHAAKEVELREHDREFVVRFGCPRPGRDEEDHEPALAASVALATSFWGESTGFERIALLAGRLENAIHRCLGQLRRVRADREKLADAPDSPFLNEPMPEPAPPPAPPAPPAPATQRESRGDERNVHECSSSSQTTKQSHGTLGKMQSAMLRALAISREELEQYRREEEQQLDDEQSAAPPQPPQGESPPTQPAQEPGQEQTPPSDTRYQVNAESST